MLFDEQSPSKEHFVFHFNSSDGDRQIRHEMSFEEFTTWQEVHKHFIDFLSAVYGYDIHGKIGRLSTL